MYDCSVQLQLKKNVNLVVGVGGRVPLLNVYSKIYLSLALKIKHYYLMNKYKFSLEKKK